MSLVNGVSVVGGEESPKRYPLSSLSVKPVEIVEIEINLKTTVLGLSAPSLTRQRTVTSSTLGRDQNSSPTHVENFSSPLFQLGSVTRETPLLSFTTQRFVGNAERCRTLGNKRLSEVGLETPSSFVWDLLRYRGKRRNPGLSRGRSVRSKVEVTRGGMKNVPRELPLVRSQPIYYERMGCKRVVEPEVEKSTCSITKLLNQSLRRVKVKRKSFGGHGELRSGEISLFDQRSLKGGLCGYNRIKCLLLEKGVSRDQLQLALDSGCRPRPSWLPSHLVLLFVDLIESKVWRSRLESYNRLVEQGAQQSSQTSPPDFNSLEEEEESRALVCSGLPRASAPPLPPNYDNINLYPEGGVTVLHLLYKSVLNLLPPSNPFPKWCSQEAYTYYRVVFILTLTYSSFLGLLALLKARSVTDLIIALELIIDDVRKNPIVPSHIKEHISIVMGTISLFLANFKVGEVVTNGLISAAKLVPGEFVPQAGPDPIGMASLMQDLAHSPLSVKVVALFASILPVIFKTEQHAFGTSLSQMCIEWLKALVNPPLEIFELALNLFKFVQERLAVYQVTGEISDLFGRSPVQDWIRAADGIESELKEIRTNPSGKDPRGLIARAGKLYEKSLKMKDITISFRAKTLKNAVDAFKNRLYNSRKPPVGFIFTGPPGIGKTVAVDVIHKCHKKRLGIDDDIGILYSWSSTNFQTLPSIVSIIHVNDAFQTKDDKAKRSQLEMFQQFVDSCPLEAEGASVEEKGQLLAPDMLLASTNSKSFYFSTSTGGANKLDRRYRMGNFQWLPAFVVQAEAKSLTPAQLYSQGGYTGNAVRYTIGWMQNEADSALIKFDIKKIEFETESLEAFVGFILHQESRRTEFSSSIARNTALNVCDCGLSADLEFCGCINKKKMPVNLVPADVAPYLSFLEREDIEVEDVCPQGANVSVQHSFDASTLKAVHKLSSVAEKAASTLGSGLNPKVEVSVSPDTRHFLEDLSESATPNFLDPTRIMVVVGGVSAIVTGAILILTLVNKFITQGTVSSTPSFPVPTPQEVVRPHQSTNVSWLAGASSDFMLKIRRPGITVMQGVLVTHQMMAAPKHFFDDMKEGEIFNICYRGIEHTIQFAPIDLEKDPQFDLAFYFMRNLKSVFNVAYNFLPSKDCTPTEDCNLGPYLKIRVGEGLTYRAETLDGDCGLALTGAATGTIYGFHIGYFKHSGVRVSVPLSREKVNLVMKAFQKKGRVIELLSDSLPPTIQADIDKEILKQGQHPRSDGAWFEKSQGDRWPSFDHVTIGHYASADKPRFSARKSTMHEYFHERCKAYGTPHKGHAVLNADGRWVSSTTLRFEAMGRTDILFDPVIGQKVVDSYIRRMDVGTDRLTPYSDYTALCGSVHNTLVTGKDVEKSLGRTLKRLGISKTDAFRFKSEGEYEVHPVILEQIKELERHLESDEPLTLPVVEATAKDEVYSVEKAAKGRKRDFFVSDWVDNHTNRKYILPLITYLMERARNSYNVTTVNATSPQWKGLYEELTKFGPLVYDGDQVMYDCHHKVLMAVYHEFMIALAKALGYSERETRIVRRLLLRTSRYLIVLEGNVYICFSGLTSGKTDTSICNGVQNVASYFYIFYKNLPEFSQALPEQEMSLAVTGDDSALNPSDFCKTILDGPKLIAGMWDLGYELTSGDKTSEFKLKPIEEISYLKRGFKVDGNRVLAPLAKDSIFKSLSYCSGISSDPKLLEERDRAASHSALREMLMYSQSDFNGLKSELEKIFPDEDYPDYSTLLWEYDEGVFQAWAPRRAPIRVYTKNLDEICRQGIVDDGTLNQSNRVEYTQGVVYHVENRAIQRCPTLRRGALADFPVQTLAKTNRDSNLSTTLFSTEINSTQETVNALAAPVTHITVIETDAEVIDRASAFPYSIDSQQDFTEFFNRPRKIRTIASNVSGLNLFPLLSDWKALAPVNLMYRQWGLFRGNAKVTVSYTGSSSLMGLVRVYFYPHQGVGDTRYNPPFDYSYSEFDFNMMTTSNIPHLDLDLSSSCTCEIDLPYIHNKFQSAWEDDWMYGVKVINPGIAVSGLTPPVLNIDIFASYSEVKLSKVRFVTQGGAEVSSRFLSNGLALAGYLAGSFPNFLSPYAAMMSRGAKAVYEMGYSRAVEPVSSSIQRRLYGHLSYNTGEASFADVLGSNPMQMSDVSGSMLPGETVTDVSQIYRKWSQLSASYFDGIYFAVSPGSHFPVSEANGLSFSHHSQAAFMYERWSGDIDVKIVVSGSPLVRWRIGIVVLTAGEQPLLAFPTDGSKITHIMEVAGSTEYEFSVPYVNATPYLSFQTRPWNDSSSVQAGIQIFQLMLPVGPADTPIYPYVNVWVRGGEDFSLSIPSLNALSDFVSQGGREAYDVSVYGEKVTGLGVLAKRKTFTCRTYNGRDQLGSMNYPSDGLPVKDITSLGSLNRFVGYNQGMFTFDSYIRSMFLGYRGSSCHTFWSYSGFDYEVSTKNTGLTTVPLPLTTEMKAGRGGTIWMQTGTPLLEVVAPDRSGYTFKKSRWAMPTIDSAVECVTLDRMDLTPTVTDTTSMKVYSCAGDDRMYVLHLGFLRLKNRV